MGNNYTYLNTFQTISELYKQRPDLLPPEHLTMLMHGLFYADRLDEAREIRGYLLSRIAPPAPEGLQPGQREPMKHTRWEWDTATDQDDNCHDPLCDDLFERSDDMMRDWR